ncbi:MAG: DUF3822 family protein [Bacteroidia bacterium]|nr:MAG: DUF3822 family protein [Bacteroidia bacterium]
MPVHLNNILSISDPVNHKGNEQKLFLSIGFLPDGFLYAILDADAYRYIALEEFKIADKTSGFNHYLSDIQTIISENPLLNKSFQKVFVYYHSPGLVLIPQKIYREQEKDQLYGMCVTPDEEGQIRVDSLNILKAKGLYVIPQKISSLLHQFFPECRIRHYGTALIESILASQKLERWQADMVIHLNETHIEILLLENQSLLFYRSFNIQFFDDVLYHAFYVLEKFGWNAGDLHTVFLGKIAMDSREYETVRDLFGKVSFPDRNDAYRYARAFDDVPYHYYYNLLNLNSCG